MKPLLKQLTEIFGPSGYEENIRKLVRAEVKPLADEIKVDALGNLIARKRPSKYTKDTKKIMIAAHMDEIGLMVSHIDENGFARFSNIGGVFGRYVLGGRVRFLNGTAGVIGFDRFDKMNEVPPLDKIYIDVGATSKKDCPVKVGDVAAFDRSFVEMGDRLVAKSMDDRVGVLVAIETLRALKSTPHDVYFVFTTQEEVGTRGAGTSAFGIDPDLGIAVDVTAAADTPNALKMEMKLGKGPCVKFQDGGMIADPRVVKWMIRTAEKSKIPYQREVLLFGSTDARAMQLTRAGVPAGCLSIPVRYVHSPSEMVDYNDVQNSVKLLTALLRAKVELSG
ncbi:MAG: M42 family metallopeptidase [Anaerolineae bacterium]|nr:M42 family metallopeptidase [Anaerolineae bacterium]MBL8106493.1 M42 family metallopeptidase [Anaerolineales bacterium]MCC7190596.1 M42 family metallopeptidase [Anaerolineales bacterium]